MFANIVLGWCRNRLLALFLMLAFALAACQTDDGGLVSDIGARAVANMSGPDGTSMGAVSFQQGSQGVLVSAELAGLTQGGHGFHIHESGNCQPDFSAAGDHFNPSESGHGFLHGDSQHAGDLPNIFANELGEARAEYFTAAITLAKEKDNSLFDPDGSAVIVHEKPDTYGEAAGAGGRVACGVIQSN